MEAIRVLLVDDHSLLRAGLRSLLTGVPGIEVVGEASDGAEAMGLTKKHRPNVILMDIAMPGMNGLDATARISREFPSAHVIILSMHANEEYVSQALRAGAAGYLSKHASSAELELAVKAVARGDMYLTPAVSKQVVGDYVRRIAGESGSLELLTPRQQEILKLIAEGETTKSIAQRLRISVKTVETHRTQLMERLDIYDVAGLVRFALRAGLVAQE